MSIEINLHEKKDLTTIKDNWFELGKKYGANTLTILTEDDVYPDGADVECDEAYSLSWEIEEDDIHLYGSKDLDNPELHLNESIFEKESIEKLEKAIKCYKEINKNRKKYYGDK